jgi:hypothetical protein
LQECSLLVFYWSVPTSGLKARQGTLFDYLCLFEPYFRVIRARHERLLSHSGLIAPFVSNHMGLELGPASQLATINMEIIFVITGYLK